MPDKYPVLQGSSTASVGFCTVWNKLDVATTAAPELLEKAAILGTLYSRQGVNPLLRNLALNPHIRTLAIWGFGPLSQSPFGRSGTDIIKALWEHGVDSEGVIQGTEFQIEPEIDPSVIETVRQNVTLLDLSEHQLKEAVAQLPTEAADPYMEPVAFDPPAPRPVETLPREDVGFTVRGTTVLDAWQQVVFQVMRYGTVKGTQYGMEQRELPAMQWVIEAEPGLFPSDVPEDWPSELCETVGVTKDAVEQYHKVFMESTVKEGVAYTYGSRLRAWADHHTPEPIDQVTESLIGNLKRSPDSRRGVAVTYVPTIDAKATVDQPCIVSVQALQADGKVNLFATFRSHDIFKAAVPNAFGLLAMQQQIADETGFERGSLCIQSISAHIYEGDFDHANKLIDCLYLGRDPKRVWDAAMADPRGSFLIRLSNGEIIAEHQGADGAILGEYRGNTAREVSLKISQLNLVSQIGHALDLGHELQKAEHALKLGLTYVQDPPLDFSPLAIPEQLIQKDETTV